jgi:hypothetical protein
VKRTAAFIALAATLALAPDAGAIDFGLGLFKRKQQPQKAEPPSKVKQLVATLQTDLDEKKRRAAAEELRGIDPRNAPEVVPALIGSLQKDPSPAVRIEAVESLGKLKPVATQAGIAMETALQADPDAKVREAVKAALWQYHLNGYRPPTNSPFAAQTGEPPFAPKPTTSGFRPITNTVGKGVNFPQTAEPPLAKPKPKATPAPTVTPPPKVTEPPKSTEPTKTTLPLPMPTTPAPTIPAPPSSTPSPAPSSGTPVGLPPVSVPTIPTPPPGPGKPNF